MKKLTFLLFIFVSIFNSCISNKNQSTLEKSAYLGEFEDDYEIKYTISDSIWTFGTDITFNILEWNTNEQFILAQNAATNTTDPYLFTRIDYMDFENMEPYSWGFCISNYNAASVEEAKATLVADRSKPKEGCNGFPFSRMKRIEP